MNRRLLALVAIVAAGLGLLLYPTAADWFAVRNQASELTGYAQAVDAMPGPERAAMLAEAERYNHDLARGQTGLGQVPDADYLSQLLPQPGQVMAEVSVPSIGVTLPIYHGTSDDVLSRGAGHVYGTALPVGGPGTHAVVSAHSGLVNAALFTDLDDVRHGDVFTVEVVGRRMHYRVDRISTVDPTDISVLAAIPGKDYVTLLTCTPIGVNTHRLLVRGERIDPVPEDVAKAAIDGRDTDPGFPWWAVIWTGGVLGAYVVGRLAMRPRDREDADPDADEELQPQEVAA